MAKYDTIKSTRKHIVRILKITTNLDNRIHDLKLKNRIIVTALAKQKNVEININKMNGIYAIELALLENSSVRIHYRLL